MQQLAAFLRRRKRPLFLLGVLLMAVGLRIFISGFLAEIMVRGSSLPQQEKMYAIREPWTSE